MSLAPHLLCTWANLALPLLTFVICNLFTCTIWTYFSQHGSTSTHICNLMFEQRFFMCHCFFVWAKLDLPLLTFVISVSSYFPYSPCKILFCMKHDLARSCFQLLHIIGDEGDTDKAWYHASSKDNLEEVTSFSQISKEKWHQLTWWTFGIFVQISSMRNAWSNVLRKMVRYYCEAVGKSFYAENTAGW